MAKITLFAQLAQHLPKDSLKKVIRESGADKHSKGFNTWSHLISMVFCQFASCGSLRDISNGLKSATGNLNHLGIQRAPSKSTLSYQNEHRDSSVFRDCYYKLFEYLGQQAVFKQKRFRFKMPVKLLDSTLISLCMTVYDWAHYTHEKGAVKMHTLLDFDMLLPEYIHITDGKGSDGTSARHIEIKPFSLVVADRGYCDFGLLSNWDSMNVCFVVRHKGNLVYHTVEELPLPEKRHQDVLIDEIIELDGTKTKEKYPQRLRRIAVYNEEHGFTIELLTNNMKLAASTIADLYKARWEIEMFFRNLKQLFHIKSFVGTSRNAVEIQLWTSLMTILLMAYLKAIAKYPWHLSNLVHSLRLNTFTKIDLKTWLDDPFSPPSDDIDLEPGVS